MGVVGNTRWSNFPYPTCLLFPGLLLGSLFQPDKKKEVPVHVHYYRRYGGYGGQYGGYAGY